MGFKMLKGGICSRFFFALKSFNFTINSFFYEFNMYA